MKMMWTYRVATELNVKEYTLNVVSIGEKIYLLRHVPPNQQFRIFEFDIDTMCCFEVMQDFTRQIYKKHSFITVAVYEKSIILCFNPYPPSIDPIKDPTTSTKWYQLDTITQTGKEIKFKNDGPELEWTGKASSVVIGEQLYMWLCDASGINAFNLKTLRWTLVNYSHQSMPRQLCGYIVVAHGTDIYCFNENIRQQPIHGLFVFSTLSKVWTRIDNTCHSYTNDNLGDVLLHSVAGTIANDKLMILSHLYDRNRKLIGRLLDLFHIKTKQWTTLEFPLLSTIDDLFGGDIRYCATCCAVNQQLFFFHNVYECVGSAAQCGAQVHTLHLMPSLQMLCKCVIVRKKLDSSKLPKSLQNRINEMKIDV